MKRQKNSSTNTNPTNKTPTNINYNLPTIDPNTFNQTIIINNPNFNINYIQSANNPANPNNASNLDQKDARKTQNDNWNLNCNLKEFSQTRQLGFFNGKQKKNVSTKSPYMIPKNRTQDIKSVNKIRPNQTLAAYNQPGKQHPQKNNRSIPVITRDNSTKQHHTLDHQHNNLTINREPLGHGTLSTFRTKKYAYTQRTPRQISGEKSNQASQLHLAKIEDDRINDGKQVKQALTEKLKKGFLNTGTTFNNGHVSKIKNIRKNRFSSLQEENPQRNNTRKTVHEQDQKNSSENNDSPDTKDHSPSRIVDKIHRHKFQHKHHHSVNYGKSIQVIQSSLLSNLSSYMDGQETTVREDMPGSKIQLYMTTMKEPEPVHLSNNPEYRSTPIQMWDEYDFKFQQQKIKKRPKTPKRKKLYQ